MKNINESLAYRVNHLLDIYDAHGNIVIGVDFDHTLVDSHSSSYPIYADLAKLLRTAQGYGCKLCVWTANPDEYLVRDKWKQAHLIIDYYNDSPLHFNNVKPHFNLLLDDTAGLKNATKQLRVFLLKLQHRSGCFKPTSKDTHAS